MKNYDVVIVGAGPGGIFTAYELVKQDSSIKVAIIEKGNSLHKRSCPAVKTNSCANCNPCNIMNGYGGAGAFSDGKFNITNSFGGTLYEYVGEEKSIELQEYVDHINCKFGGNKAKLYESNSTKINSICLKNNLHLLSAKVRHLGTDINYKILENMFSFLHKYVDFYFNEEVESVSKNKPYIVNTTKNTYTCNFCVVSVGRSGNNWTETFCKNMNIDTTSNQIDIGVRVELPAQIFEHLTKDLYEAKIVYRTTKYSDLVRTFCMNPYGYVVNENTNGIITVNGHSFDDKKYRSKNTNFALLVSKKFTKPFKDSNEYGASIAKLSNMLGGGVIVQRFGDLMKGQRSTEKRIKKNFVTPTLKATPGDLSLVIPKRILDDIIEMINTLEKIAPGIANQDTLLYGVEVKFYNTKVNVNSDLETKNKNLFVIGDCSGITHSLSHASASGVHVARVISNRLKNYCTAK